MTNQEWNDCHQLINEMLHHCYVIWRDSGKSEKVDELTEQIADLARQIRDEIDKEVGGV